MAPGSLQVATTYHKRATVVSHDKKHMFVTSNGGQTWIQVSLPSSEFDEAEDLHISDVSPDHMILVAGTEVCLCSSSFLNLPIFLLSFLLPPFFPVFSSLSSPSSLTSLPLPLPQLYHTHSAGEQWEVVASHVKLVRMVKLNRHNEFVFYLIPGKRHVLNTLHRLSLPSGDKDVLDTRVYRFAVHGHYLFISRQNFTGNSFADDASRQLYVCDHYGDDASDISFREVQLPSVTPEQVG